MKTARLISSVNGMALRLLLVSGLFAVFPPVRATSSSEPEYSREKARATFQRPTAVPHPKDNPPTADRVALGKALFFDPRLSRANSISCASCHNPSFSWGDGLSKGVGHGSKELTRRTPTLLNTAFAETLFWDGRAGSLEEQVLAPIAAPAEMNMPLDRLLPKLKSIPGYPPLFEKAYPGEGITTQSIAKAIATFERTILSGTAPFDEWIAGREDAISAAARRGFDLFNSKANCVKCHSGWNFTDDGFHDIGLADADIGRGQHLKELESMQHAFKTPTLRNVVQRAPYMHDGSERGLKEVLAFYNRGGAVKRPSLSPEMTVLNLSSAELDDLHQFLETLTGNDRPVEMPLLPPGHPDPLFNDTIATIETPQP